MTTNDDQTDLPNHPLVAAFEAAYRLRERLFYDVQAALIELQTPQFQGWPLARIESLACRASAGRASHLRGVLERFEIRLAAYPSFREGEDRRDDLRELRDAKHEDHGRECAGLAEAWTTPIVEFYDGLADNVRDAIAMPTVPAFDLGLAAADLLFRRDVHRFVVAGEDTALRGVNDMPGLSSDEFQVWRRHHAARAAFATCLALPGDLPPDLGTSERVLRLSQAAGLSTHDLRARIGVLRRTRDLPGLDPDAALDPDRTLEVSVDPLLLAVRSWDGREPSLKSSDDDSAPSDEFQRRAGVRRGRGEQVLQDLRRQLFQCRSDWVVSAPLGLVIWPDGDVVRHDVGGISLGGKPRCLALLKALARTPEGLSRTKIHEGLPSTRDADAEEQSGNRVSKLVKELRKEVRPLRLTIHPAGRSGGRYRLSAAAD